MKIMNKYLFKKNTLNMKCQPGNCGNVNLHFFTVNYTMTSLPKTANLTVFYSKITLNVPLYILQLFTVR